MPHFKKFNKATNKNNVQALIPLAEDTRVIMLPEFNSRTSPKAELN